MNWRQRLTAAWRGLAGKEAPAPVEPAAVEPPAGACREGALVYARVAGAVRLVQIIGRAPAGAWFAAYEERTAHGGRSGVFLVRPRDLLTAAEAESVFRAEAAR